MRSLAFVVASCLSAFAFGQGMPPTGVTHVGDVTIDRWDFNTPLVGPGMLFPTPDFNAHQGVFFPSPVQTYFSQPIPDGGPQVGYAGADGPNVSGALLFDLGTIVPGGAPEEIRFAIDVGSSLVVPGGMQAFGGYRVALFANDVGGPIILRQQMSSESVALGTFETAALDAVVTPEMPGGFSTHLFVSVTPFPEAVGAVPAISFFDNAVGTIGPPGEVPEPSAIIALCLAIGALARPRNRKTGESYGWTSRSSLRP